MRRHILGIYVDCSRQKLTDSLSIQSVSFQERNLFEKRYIDIKIIFCPYVYTSAEQLLNLLVFVTRTISV